MLTTVAAMDRDFLIERIQAELDRAKTEGKILRPKPKTTEDQRIVIRTQLNAGVSVSQVARDYGISRAAVISIRESRKIAA